MSRLPVRVQHIRPQGPQLPRPTPLHQVRPQNMQPQFQAIQQPMHQHQYQPQFAPKGPMQGQIGQARAPLGAPQRHQREVVRGIEAHFRPIITNNPSPVVIPHRADGRTFEVRTTALQSLPNFKGLATEEPYFHLETYDSICNTIGGQGFSADDVKLVLFQFSLEDKAKTWFHTLPSASIFTWADMQQIFLDEYYTSQKTNDARRGLRSFQQQSREMFHEAFERFNMMLRNCPHHGIQLWELLNAFHEGLSSEDARDIMSITNGTFGTNYEHVDWAFLEQMAVNSKRKAQSSRRARHVTQRPQVHGVDSGNVQTTNQVYHVGTNCNEIGHTAEVCVVGVVDEQVEEVNAIQGGGGRNFNMNSNTYHPGLRNHPNFRYGNAANQANPNFQGAQGNSAPRQQYNQGNYRGANNYGYQGQFQQTGQGGSGQSSSSGNEVMDMLRAMQQDMQKRNQLDEVQMQKDEVRDKSIQSLTTQMGQLATDVAELKKNKGQLPSDTKVNPSHGSSRVAKNLWLICHWVWSRGVVEDVTGNESDDDVAPVTPKESNVNKPGLGESKKSEKVEGESSQVPFPSALLDPGRKNFIASRGPQKEELWDMFKQVKINLPLLDAIKQVPAYAKFLKELCTQKRQQKKKMPKRVDLTGQVCAVLNGELPPKLKDPGTPLINIQVGNFQMAKALLDLGAGVSILPGGLYDQYDFGPLARVETTVVLADLSHKLPRGMVQNVIVKIDEFYYPIDFLVLDYSSADPKQQQNVILGRPFLSTAHAVIDCRFGTVDMTFGNRKIRLNVFTNNANDVGVDECFMADLVDGCNPYEYEEDGIDICLCDFSEQVHACALAVEEEKQDAMALKEGRPLWTH
ncbi:putative retrotransposon gag domain, aspartic peptidase domain superfamily [Helianthus annuus]|nr:putative retrotransposon gag domain, aspartic peptidase domain superfamily [Helianthus annuus]